MPSDSNDTLLSGVFRQQAEDFYVDEVLGFDLSGQGEHICILLEKRGQNTHWVAAQLAEYAGISERDVGYCGRKDRHAVTRQWFSLYDPERKNIAWSDFCLEGVNILKRTRHIKKLRPGMHQQNHFVIRLRNVTCADSDLLLNEAQKQSSLIRINTILAKGVPNYFGPQRFGREGSNLLLANAWLVEGKAPPRKQKSMVLSAARAYLFNLVLAARVRQQIWCESIPGDVLNDDRSTGPLWGRGRLTTKDQALACEQQALSGYDEWCHPMEHRGLQQERRNLLLLPSGARCEWQGHDLVLSFNLPAGTFATSVLAEIAHLKTTEYAA